MAINRDSTIPPPMIGKIGPYTVFMTPPSTPKPSQPPVLDSPKKIFTPPPVLDSPKKIITPPPVQPPPHQFHKSTESVASNGSVLGFFKNAATKVQNAHSSLDGHLARWFGLNQSKYQWALDDYYESKGSEKGEANAKDIPSKAQSV
ncbi:pre-mRNA 3'-end-processing factor FIP1-like isoform X2 [Juglans microcarpa x Juglans regia]|uniref:pre-mRNA 3'-end-processing factor FIP1-like isoform X2 n=1 Tax=Juglans microcarpa x Juglans regia TaxID=2249226 RepID=UPI001B7E368D|nr:pre-mRNA 3'-end-processing factor FIP1-like isoform X2 [Juglans microcarpa x Juglans regia]